MFRKISEEPIKIPEVISAGPAEIIGGLLERDVQKRWELKQVLMHPWVIRN